MRCPVCEDQLRPLERNGVEIEMCPSCKGVWLDRGELDALLESAAGGGAAAGRPRSEERTHSDDHGHSDDRKHSDDREYSKDREHSKEHEYTDDRGRPVQGKKKSGGLFGNLMDTFGGGGD
jgi:Zn-finger nucleic acid-binding protein